MKAVFVTLLSLAASAFASPVASRDVTTTQTNTVEKNLTITTLTQQVKTYTSQINSTIASVDVDVNVDVSTSILDTVGADLEGITDLLHSATKAAAKPAFWEGEKDQLLSKVTALVSEILYTVKAVVDKLGLSGILAVLQPLLIAIGGLVRSLDLVVDNLLSIVQGLLDTVLGAVSDTLTNLL